MIRQSRPHPLEIRADDCSWVERRLGRPLRDVEKELVTVLCAGFATGAHNIHPDWSILKRCGVGASMSVSASWLNTWDTNGLTRLVFAAHDRCCRVELRPAGPHRISIRVWKRARAGGLARRHPTLREALLMWGCEPYPERGAEPKT